ncbi:hypothetical protein PI23P_12257 [Polaribacter irgensii 23-P]|uniref:Uncharacterized protein n=1 Tax=Polaribacter irgensii 23-P TaxID=313594 RepID=A4C1V4_9FLAO|nr:hypothetical protein PI23P_12257 [Polaribacter irgensii 23-P]
MSISTNLLVLKYKLHRSHKKLKIIVIFTVEFAKYDIKGTV